MIESSDTHIRGRICGATPPSCRSFIDDREGTRHLCDGDHKVVDGTLWHSCPGCGGDWWDEGRTTEVAE